MFGFAVGVTRSRCGSPLQGSKKVATALAVTALHCASMQGPAAAQDARKLAYGKHLSAECTTCHRLDGVDNGIPSITGWDGEEFLATLIFYRNGERTNQAMVSVAQSLDDDQMKALASYFATLPKSPKKSK